MAYLNTTYSGTPDFQDPDVIIAKLPGFWPWQAWRNIYLPDEIRDQIRKQNADAISTTDAVKVAYKGTTDSEREAWINERINAINERVKFIKTRTDQLLSRLQSQSADSYNAFSKIVTSALSLVPVVGSAITLISNQANTAQAIEQLKVQSLIQAYADDLKQLATIRNQLLADLVKIGTTDTTTDPTNNAATAVPTWYYFAGFALLLLFFLWLKNRNRR
ncbi:hypothetical protein GCM10028806_19520 [Spirosoma terrae]|uniref:Uncharacterized protein n=1 Tax=Spirosoma terrae TaxID=1968276 RepID=A0A6L9L6F3_9BACT|nr:hypothetical protein [Spirosoma terrae]NDU94731.1 hypothetical protein [Spirosoma terrae]